MYYLIVWQFDYLKIKPGQGFVKNEVSIYFPIPIVCIFSYVICHALFICNLTYNTIYIKPNQVYGITSEENERLNSFIFILQTDDKGVFSTSVTEEYEKVSQAFNLSVCEMFDISYKSIEHIFAQDDIKESLRNRWKQYQCAQCL